MELRRIVLATDPCCVMCRLNNIIKLAQEVDHIIPLEAGGTNDLSNLQGLCREHHYKKTCSDQGKTYKQRMGVDGLPQDPDHHWNR